MDHFSMEENRSKRKSNSSNSARAACIREAKRYRERAKIFKKIVSLLEDFSELEKEYSTINNLREKEDVNTMYRTAKAFAKAYSSTEKLATESAQSENPTLEVLKQILEAIEKESNTEEC